MPVVVIIASTPFHGHRLYDQRIARSLTAGHQVIYVEPPVPFGRGSATSVGADPPGIRIVRPRMLPYGRRAGLAWLTALEVGRQARAAIRTAGPVDVVICIAAHPVTMRMVRRWPAVLLLKDDYVAGASLINVPVRLLTRRRRALLRQADRVVVVSPVLRDTVVALGMAPELVAVVPAGADPIPPAESEPAELAGIPHPRAAFVGMMSDRIDFEMLRGTVEAGLSIVVVGRTQNTFSDESALAPLIATGHVHALGEKSSADVARILRNCSVGLVPYTLSEFNLSSFPLKTLEYLAAGLPVVASRLPALVWLDAPHVHLSDQSADAARSATEAAVADSRRPETSRQCEEFAAGHSWTRRAETFLEIAGHIARPAGSGRPST